MAKKEPEGSTAIVAELPMCGICTMNGDPTVPAQYDGSVNGGSWAFMCVTHFTLYGPGRLGTGIAQRLVVESEQGTEERPGFDCEKHGMRHPLIAHWECYPDLLARAAEQQHEEAYGA